MDDIREITAKEVINYRKTIGNNIQFYRNAKGLSQQQLADIIGISPTAMGSVEVGRNLPKAETVLKLAEALGVEPHEFYVLNRERRTDHKIAGLNAKIRELNEKNKIVGNKINAIDTFEKNVTESYKAFKKAIKNGKK